MHAAAAIHLTAEGLQVGSKDWRQSQVSQKTITGQSAPCSGTPINDHPDHTLPSTLRHPLANLLLCSFSGVSPPPIHQCGTVSQSLVTCLLLTCVSACHAVTANVAFVLRWPYASPTSTLPPAEVAVTERFHCKSRQMVLVVLPSATCTSDQVTSLMPNGGWGGGGNQASTTIQITF